MFQSSTLVAQFRSEVIRSSAGDQESPCRAFTDDLGEPRRQIVQFSHRARIA